MNQTLFLMSHELKLMWKEFKFSLKKPMTKILIAVIVGAVIVINSGLSYVLFVFSKYLPTSGGELLASLGNITLTRSMIYGVVYFMFVILLVSAFFRGIISSNFGFLFTRNDESIIIPSPTSSRTLYVAKKLRGLILHILFVSIIILAGFPLITVIGFQGFGLAILFLALLALIEIVGLVENISYCMSRTMFTRENRLNRLTWVAFLVWTIFIVSSPLILFLGGSSLSFLAYLYPSYVCSMMLVFGSSFNVTLGASFLLGEFLLFFVAATSIAKPGLSAWASSPKSGQTRGSFVGLRKNKLSWRTGKGSGVRAVLAKDFWVTVRNPSRFFIPLAIAVVLFLFAFGLQTVSPLSMSQLSISKFADVLFIPLIYLITVFVLSPAWDAFASERRTIFILKSSPIKPSRIIWGKYLFALMQSASYTIPLVAAISVLLPRAPNILLVTLEVAPVLLVSNAIGILASVSYPPAYRGVGPPPFLILLGLPILSVILTLIVPISLVLFYPFVTLQGFLLALTIFCVIGVVGVVARWGWLGLVVIVPIAMLFSYPYSTSYDFGFAFMLFYVFIVVTSCLNRVEKSFGRLEEFRGRY